ncbi:hypothetical protein J3458_002838 [Metarhizium acridum]|uniref:uncharacterized protein n=1 Tax=Metarhizium acridum TaxID=92637 RepID=UPI001C6C4C40|nr:hypothetical protein J3458_002838 [Metarhizium acridum]
MFLPTILWLQLPRPSRLLPEAASMHALSWCWHGVSSISQGRSMSIVCTCVFRFASQRDMGIASILWQAPERKRHSASLATESGDNMDAGSRWKKHVKGL